MRNKIILFLLSFFYFQIAFSFLPYSDQMSFENSISSPNSSNLQNSWIDLNTSNMDYIWKLENKYITDSELDPRFAEDYRWLYELLISDYLRQSYPEESFKSFKVHLKDSYKIFPNPNLLTKENLKNWPDKSELTGTLLYAGIVRKVYRMDILKNKSGFVFNIRVHLKNPTQIDLIQFNEKIKIAESIWNQSRIKLNFNYQFKFEIVNDSNNAHYSVNLQNSTRGPYDTNWGRDWTGVVLAHELGHMLGLGDEYQTVSGKMDCLQNSLMCSSWSGDLMLHHYYFILRRLLKTEAFSN